MITNEALAREIIEFIKELDMWSDVAVYFDGKRIRDDEHVKDSEIVEEVNVNDYVEYNNPEGITLTFEGPFYSALHGEFGWNLKESFDDLLREHGMYMEFGHTWSAVIVS